MNQYSQADQYLNEIFQRNYVTKEKEMEFQKSISSLIEFFRQFDYSHFGSGVDFLIFGSFLNGFGTSSSDIDFTFVTNNYVNEKNSINYIASIIRQVDQEKFKIDQIITSARIPVLKITDTKRNIEIDICFNNILGTVNTELLKAYSDIDERIKKGGVLLKLWGKKANIINKNLFSSYAILIMWLHCLQRFYGLPNLQNPQYNKPKQNTKLQIKRTLEGTTQSSFEADVFFTYKGKIYDDLKKEFQQKNANVSLHEMLIKFFQYYSDDGDGFRQEYKISINKKELKETGETYSMSDPFDLEHDPIKKVRGQFRDTRKFKEAATEMQSQNLSLVIRKLFDR